MNPRGKYLDSDLGDDETPHGLPCACTLIHHTDSPSITNTPADIQVRNLRLSHWSKGQIMGCQPPINLISEHPGFIGQSSNGRDSRTTYVSILTLSKPLFWGFLFISRHCLYVCHDIFCIITGAGNEKCVRVSWVSSLSDVSYLRYPVM